MNEEIVDSLSADEAAIADAVMTKMEEAKPDMYQIYRNERVARLRCREDVAFHIQHLAAALAVDDRDVFIAYRRWLEEMLASRSIPTDDVVLSFTTLRDEIAERYGAAAEPAVTTIEAAL